MKQNRTVPCLGLLRAREEEALGLGERVAEVASVAVRADLAGEHHAADLGLVARVADDGAELGDAVRELALLAVGARPRLLPLVAQLRLQGALSVSLQLHLPVILLLATCVLRSSFPVTRSVKHRIRVKNIEFRIGLPN